MTGIGRTRPQIDAKPQTARERPQTHGHGTDALSAEWCEDCGHDWDRHRRGRCWTGFDGEPVTRARTQIDCQCLIGRDDA